METATATFPLTLWRVMVALPGGFPRVVEVRAVSEALAIERVRQWLPEHSVLEVARRPTS